MMKRKEILIPIICVIFFGLISCSDDGNSYPLPSEITNVHATPAPSSITLSWDLPEDGNIRYVEIRYSIPEFKKTYRKQVSTFANSFILEDMLEKYGVIDFELQPFNDGETGGKTISISAQAEKAPPTYGNPEKLTLSASGLYTNAPFPTRPLSNLVDGNLESFFHSQWQTTVALPHYIVVDLGTEIEGFRFRSTNTNRASDRSWKTLNIYGSTGYDPEKFFDGKAFIDGNTVDISTGGTRLIAELEDLPGGVSEVYQSDIIISDVPVRWLWFETTETTDGAQYFALGELEIYKYEIIYPE